MNQVDVQACLLDSFVYNNVKMMEQWSREDFKKMLVKQVEVEYNVTQSFIC